MFQRTNASRGFHILKLDANGKGLVDVDNSKE